MARFVRCTTKEQADAIYQAGLAWFDANWSAQTPELFDGVHPHPFVSDDDLPSTYANLPATDWLYLLED